MRHNDAYQLMMVAIDGELTSQGWLQLDLHLRSCSICAREWVAVQAIDALFRQTPALSPAAGFSQRTLARLPGTPYRIWLLGAFYVLLLISGLAPLAGLILIAASLDPAASQAALIEGLLASATQLWQLSQVIAGALWQGFVGLGSALGQQPAILGWLLVLAGILAIWNGTHGQLVGQRREA